MRMTDDKTKLVRGIEACDYWDRTTVLESVRNCAKAIRAVLTEEG